MIDLLRFSGLYNMIITITWAECNMLYISNSIMHQKEIYLIFTVRKNVKYLFLKFFHFSKILKFKNLKNI